MSTWQFDVRVAVCRNCGFLFASPAPDSRSLYDYYSDGISGAKEIGPPYSIERRIEALGPYAKPSAYFVEVGSDGGTEFHARLRTLFGHCDAVDVSNDLDSRLRSVADLPEGAVDVIAHYDVLEHVVDVRQFLTHCRRALKDGGVMFCEVPDARLYPRNLLICEFEHVNHFTISTLALVASRVGFELVEVNHTCSRPFGMLAIFRKAEPVASDVRPNREEYLDAIANLQGGLHRLRENTDRIAEIRHEVASLASSGEVVVLWAVTDFLREFLEDFELPRSVAVVDMDPRRRNHLQSVGITVHQPLERIEEIRESRLIVLFAPRYKDGVLGCVQQLTGRILGASEIVVIGSDRFGQTLN